MTITEKLRHLEIDRVDLDEAVTLSALAKMLRAEYGVFGVEPPAWLNHRINTLAKEIIRRQSDFLEKRLVEAKARYEQLKPVDQKRADLEKEIAELSARVEQSK